MSKLIIIRGAPGAGKSTLANKIVSESDDPSSWVICEADQYFSLSGEYKFDFSQLGRAHEWCQNKVEHALSGGKNVIVSNTSTTRKEVSIYFMLAKEAGVIPEVITLKTNYGNIHGVPQEKVDQMANRLLQQESLIDLLDSYFPDRAVT